MKYLIFYIVMLIAIASYANIDAIWAIIKINPALDIAALALFLTVFQGWQNHRHNKLTVLPCLITQGEDILKDKMKYVKFKLINAGIGPAVITDVKLFFDGNIKADNSHTDYHDCLKEKFKHFIDGRGSSITSGSIIPAGESHTMWSFSYDPETQNTKIADRLGLLVEYKSIYGKKMIPCDTRDNSYPVLEEEPEDSPIVPSLKAKNMARAHATSFTIPRPWTADEFDNILKSPNIFDITHEFGFVIGQRIDEEQIELITFAVIRHEQGKGYGQNLLTAFIAEVTLNRGKSIFLEVAENNAPALHLYEKAGFKRVGLRPAYYEVPNTPNIDAITMRLDITE